MDPKAYEDFDNLKQHYEILNKMFAKYKLDSDDPETDNYELFGEIVAQVVNYVDEQIKAADFKEKCRIASILSQNYVGQLYSQGNDYSLSFAFPEIRMRLVAAMFQMKLKQDK